MKKLLLFLVALAIAGFVGAFAWQTWQSTAFIRAQGSEATLVAGDRYNASRWAEPLPLKKLQAYPATLAPEYDVIIVSDQDLVSGRQYFIRFLPREQIRTAPATPLRPIPGRLRARTTTDTPPSRVPGTEKLERLLDRAMGNKPSPATAASSAIPPLPNDNDGSVPFVFVEADESLFETLWRNSRGGEWLAMLFALLISKALFIQACAEPWRVRRSPSDDKEFINPALARVDPDPPPPPPRPIPIPFKPSAPAATPAPEPPVGVPEPVLKLPRDEQREAPSRE